MFYVYPAICQVFDPAFLNKKYLFFSVATNFDLELAMQSVIKITGLEEPKLWGKASMYIIPQKMLFWHVYQLIDWAQQLYNCYITFQLWKIFTYICNGEAFRGVISRCLNKIAIVIIAWHIATPFVQYYGYGLMLKNIAVNTKALKLTPHFFVQTEPVFIGIALLVLAGVINEAVKIHEEQRLTI